MLKAAGLRLRPILMTTFATVLGVVAVADGLWRRRQFKVCHWVDDRRRHDRRHVVHAVRAADLLLADPSPAKTPGQNRDGCVGAADLET